MFKEKASFSSKVRVITPAEYSTHLSIASLADLRKLFPDEIDTEQNPDLLLNAFNSAVANRINANDDGIGTDTALSISKNFLYKPTNLDHDRDCVVGHIVSQGFSTFGSNQMIADPASLAGTDAPFNIALGAVVWRSVAPNFARLLVEASDETSQQYGYVSASWEIGFNKYQILLGHRDVSEGELITDEKQIAEFAKLLRCYGGAGVTKDEVPVYRLIVGGLPLGIGYTTTPAADVKGVVTPPDEAAASKVEERPSITLVATTEHERATVEANKLSSSLFALAEELKSPLEDITAVAQTFSIQGLSTEEVIKRTRDAIILAANSGLAAEAAAKQLTAVIEQLKKEKESFSQSQNAPVKESSIMELKSLSDLTDDFLKTAKASVITDFINDQILKIDEKWKQQIAQKESDAKSLNEKVEQFQLALKEASEALKKNSEDLAKLQQVQAQESADRVFNDRMSSLNEKYDLDEKWAAIVAKSIAGLSDEDYAKWLTETFSVIAAQREKKPAVAAKPVEQAQASTQGAAAVEQALDNVKLDKDGKPVVPNSASVEQNDYDKYKDAFSGDGVKITSFRR